ncbi:ribonuclease inhibitor-like, partial [Ctenopharyngodon idella]|uniref:ribonuclease inhibitor-like n=1 Tax=Ctenopharyngodon idella TaxID=7959 RepID=UPI00222EB470
LQQRGCAALTSAFNSNPSNLIELDLSGNKLETQEWRRSVICLKIHMQIGEIECRKTVQLSLQSEIKLQSEELDISNKNLQDSGVKKLQNALENTNCTLEKLRLSDCSITEEGYKALASALRSNPSHLIELDLTGNDPGQSGVKELNDLLQDEHCSLKSIKFLKSTAAMEVCEYLTKVLGKSPLLLTELDLSEVKLGDLDGEKLSALFDGLSYCSVLATDLSPNHPERAEPEQQPSADSRVKEICEGLKKSTLKILKLSECDLTEESCSALASVLSSDSSYLKDLDLSNNNLQDSVVKLFSDGLKNNCKTGELRLSDCNI